MKKSKKKINGYLALALSASMTMSGVAAPLAGDADTSNEPVTNTTKTDDLTENNTEKEDEKESLPVASPSEATPNTETDEDTDKEEADDTEDKDFVFDDEDQVDEDIEEDKTETEDEKELDIADEADEEETEYPDFGTDEFWAWYKDAEEKELKAWYESVRTMDTATASDASKSYPKYDSDLESDFWTWFFDECYSQTDDDYTINFDVLFEYIQNSSYGDVKALLKDMSAMLDIRLMSMVGDLFPENYGTSFTNDGNGSIDNPYVIDSVSDLRYLATYVAMGQDTEDTYYRIKAGTYDLNGVWIPIGFPTNAGGTYIPFKGHITADSKTYIQNLGFGSSSAIGVSSDISTRIKQQESLGFFGELGAGATVENLNIETKNNTIEGTDNIGILAGKATDAVIKNCTVSGHVKGEKNVGGIVGLIESTDSSSSGRVSVIEDCKAENVAVYSTNEKVGLDGAIGGIAGYAKNTSIVDCYVSTNTGSGNHIYGRNSYVGGIAGIQDNSDIYNVHVEKGEIGDKTGYATGGIVGGYAGGKLKVARFSGSVTSPASSNNYSAAFIGARVNNAGFSYGELGDIAYLFADTANKANTGICGSKLQDDSNYGLDAHIGYWHSSDKKYTLVTGANTDDSTDYFYEELERGILQIKKEAGDTEDFVINHYTADSSGNPVRGYLLTVNNPKVEGTTAAKITAQIKESFKPVVTAESQGAFAAGDRIYVTFDMQKEGETYFKFDPDKTKNPYYTYTKYSDFGENETITNGISSDGGYWITMPSSDAIISADCVKVANQVDLTPDKVTFEITQTRTGSRENPTIKWTATAKDSNGAVITDVNGNRWQDQDLSKLPEFYIGSNVNGKENDKFNLTWTTANTDNAGIISEPISVNSNVAEKKKKFTINVTDQNVSAIAKKAKELEDGQKNGNYKDSITTSAPYVYHALVTAVAQSSDSTETNDPPKGYCDIDIRFNVVDNTNVSLQSASLNKSAITYNVERKLTGDRANPTVEYSINGEAVGDTTTTSALTATFNPDYFTSNSVNWYLTDANNDPGKNENVEADKNVLSDGTLEVSRTGDYHISNLKLSGISKTECSNAFIKAIVDDQDSRYTKELKKVPSSETSYVKSLKVTGYDDSNNAKTDTCSVTVNFKTVDETEILPTKVDINNKGTIYGYDIVYTFAGDKDSAVVDRKITYNNAAKDKVTNGAGQKLSATVTPNLDTSKDEYTPYNNEVVWSLVNPDNTSMVDVNEVLSIDSSTGQITVRGYGEGTDLTDTGYSPWINRLISEGKLDGTTIPVRIVARSAKDNSLLDTKDINISFTAVTVGTNDEEGITFDAVYTQKVATSLSGTDITSSSEWSGIDPQMIGATSSGSAEIPVFTVYDALRENLENGIINIIDPLTRAAVSKNVQINTNAQWIKDAIAVKKSGNTAQKIVNIKAKTTNGTPETWIPVTINFRYDGTEMTANKLAGAEELPSGYIASPDVVTSETPTDTYDVDKTSVKDRTINMNVVATQGNYSVNNPGTRKWSYGIAKLANTTYSSEGVKENDAVYELSGELAKYAKVENGYLVPTKGLWDDVISAGETTGTITGTITAKKDIDGKTISDSYKVTINFRYDKAVLDSHEETFDLVYTQDSLTNAVNSHWSGNDRVKLSAHITDDSGKDVTPVWESSDLDIVTVDQDGNVTVNKETWIKEIIDNAKEYGNDVHSGTKTVTVTAKHPTSGATADTCTITVNFRYDQAILNKKTESYNIVMTQTSRTNDPSVSWSGNVYKKLDAKVFLAPGMNTNPVWEAEEPEIMKVDDAGNIIPVIDSQWMKDIVAEHKFEGTKVSAVNVYDKDKKVKDSCNVTVNFQYENVEMSENTKSMDITLTASGNRSNPTYTITGNTSAISAILNSARDGETKVVYSSSDNGLVKVDENGTISLTLPESMTGSAFTTNASPYIKEAMKHAYSTSNPYVSTTTAVISASSEDGRMSDQCNLTLNMKYIDNTYSSSGGGGGGGGGSSSGGGGGSSSSGVTPGGSVSKTSKLPDYVVSGTWVQNAAGKWLFTGNGRTYVNEWAAVHNPYADASKGQSTFDWFRFDQDGFMLTGWYTDEKGDTYYLNPVSDNTLGRMFTGWNWIKGVDGKERCYYFNPNSDGTRGKLFKSCTTPDGYTVDETGAWTINGIVITR